MLINSGKKRLLTWLAGILLLLSGAALQAAESDTLPVLNNGQKWRLAYYQGGEYIDYSHYLRVTVEIIYVQGK